MSSTSLFQSGMTSSVNTTGRAPIARPLLNNEVFDIRVTEATIQRSAGQHDMAKFTCASESLLNTDGILDSPISFVYGLGARTEFFYGYVTKVSDEDMPEGTFTFTLEILGTTAYMQMGHPRFWTNKTIPSAIQDLAFTAQLGFYSPGHEYIWKTLVQTEESDWQVASALAARLGYGLFNWNGVVICRDPVSAFAGQGAYVRLVSESNIDSDERQLLEFKPGDASTQTYTGMGLMFAYLGSDLKVQVAQQSGFDAYHFVTQKPVRNQGEAEVYLAGMNKLSEKWVSTATARIYGDATIYPGVCVEIITFNPDLADVSNNGKWLVLGVEHKMDSQSYQTMLALSRPRTLPPSQVIPFRHFWEGNARGKPIMWLMDQPNKTKRWMSSWCDSRARNVL